MIALGWCSIDDEECAPPRLQIEQLKILQGAIQSDGEQNESSKGGINIPWKPSFFYPAENAVFTSAMAEMSIGGYQKSDLLS
jgi:hypothetical protein